MEKEKYNLELEKALKELTAQELLKYCMQTRLDLMELSYEKRLGKKTKQTIIKRELDLTNQLDKEVAEDALKR